MKPTIWDLVIPVGVLIVAILIAAAVGIIPGGFSNPVLHGQSPDNRACQLFAQNYYSGEYRMDGGTCMINAPAGWMEKEAARTRWINNGGKP